jgi:hypothetical protein
MEMRGLNELLNYIVLARSFPNARSSLTPNAIAKDPDRRAKSGSRCPILSFDHPSQIHQTSLCTQNIRMLGGKDCLTDAEGFL